VVSRVAPAWALDADGDPVPTRYELRGNNLVQTVDHTGADFSYPITADPWWTTAYRVGKCAASIAYVALTTVFVAGKTIQIVRAVNAARKWVAAVGGPSNAARLLTGASTKGERAKVLTQARNIVGASILNFFGITQIRANCL
jgi:hypothetical protein